MSGCYRCGSSLGNEARLCPECNQKKLEQATRWQSQSTPAGSPTGILIGPRHYLIAATLAAFAIAILSWMYQSHVRAYLGMATADDIYNLCFEGGQKVAGQTKEELGKAFVSGIMVEMCSQMKKECSRDPNGEKCQKVREFVKMMARS